MLPIIIDDDDAIDLVNDSTSNDAIKVHAIKHLHDTGMTSRTLSQLFSFSKYQLSHYSRAAKRLTVDEIHLWSRYPNRITLGHVRALTRLPSHKRWQLLNTLATKKRLSVRTCEQISRGETPSEDTDIKTYAAEVSEQLGRGIRIQYNQSNKTGKIILDFYTLEDLEDIVKVLPNAQKC